VSRTRRGRPRTVPTLDTTSTDVRPLTPVERDRLRQRYRHLVGRSITLGFASLRIVVTAATSDEMVAATAAAIAEATQGQPSS
jgi:hypothetical protein